VAARKRPCFNSSVPPAPVYLVKFCSMARTAAYYVVRCGKIRLASTEIHHIDALRPAAFSASAATFMVDETLMLAIRSQCRFEFR